MDDSQIATTKVEDDEDDLASRSPRESQLTVGNSSFRSHSISRSPVLPNVSNIRDAKLAIAQRHLENPDEDSSLLPMEDPDRPEQESAVTATTANSSWSQLPIAQPIDVLAQESSLSLLPNSRIVPISASQIDRGEISSIRDELLRRSVRSSSNSGGLRSVSQVTTTDTDLTLSSGGTPSTEPIPRRQIIETTEEVEVDDDEADHPSSSKQYVNKLERESCGVRSNTTIAVIAVLVVIVAAVVAGVCLSGQCKGTENDSSTTPSPTVFVDRRIRISEFVQSITLTKVRIVYPKPQSWTPTNQEKALYWLLDDDPLQLQGFEYELSRVRQRFALVSIWFSTVPQSLWENTTNWLTGTHECDWANVVCSETSTDRQVTDVRILHKLELGASGVVGVIPDDLALLSDSLQHLQIAYNGLTGTIPSSLGLLTKLTFFDAVGNVLNGTIPSSLSRWSELEIFRVGLNDLTGTIPTELGQWTNAKVLSLFKNEITGTVPTSLGKMSLLKFLWIQNTLISGSLPTSLSILVNATEVFVFNTKLNGTMPLCHQDEPVFGRLVADCNEVICPCCTYCCPDRFGTISAYADC